MKNMNEKIDEARTLLLQATKILTEITEGEEENGKWMDNRLEFWSRILLEGGTVSEGRAHEIWEKVMHKDARGYGGHFVGKKASLAYTHDKRVTLTSYAEEKCKAWTGIGLEEYAQRFKRK